MMHPDILQAVAAAHRDDLVRAGSRRTGRVVRSRPTRVRRLLRLLGSWWPRRPGRRPRPAVTAAAGRC